MRNVRVMNTPVGILAALVLLFGYMLWAVEAAVAKPAQGKLPCSLVEISAPANALTSGNNS